MNPPAQSSQQRYDHLPTSDISSNLDPSNNKYPTAPTTFHWSKPINIGRLICATIFIVVGSFAFGYSSAYHSGTELSPVGLEGSSSGNCTKPYFRNEWRSLSNQEKQDYLDAFQCFIETPSQMKMNGTLYDDFSWVHNLIAHRTHTKAPFLTWHRRFIFVYERRLREICGYKGALPFWDWSLDWEDPPHSPIFDSKLGFGGDGDPKAPKHKNFHCVTDLPFKNLRPQWYGGEYKPHCLSRSFHEDWFGHYMNPAALEKIIASKSYEEFFLVLEMGPHNIIPMGVRGDFISFTAPNDPIFYLHHSQLDRVWWLWQLRDKKNRVHDSNGHTATSWFGQRCNSC